MEEPQISEALATRTVYEMSAGDKLKIMTCLMQQILSYATVRDVIDERYQEMTETRMELRKHQIQENKRQREMDEKGREKRRQERMQKKGDGGADGKAAAEAAAAPAATASDEGGGSEAHLTERQRLAIQVSGKRFGLQCEGGRSSCFSPASRLKGPKSESHINIIFVTWKLEGSSNYS